MFKCMRHDSETDELLFTCRSCGEEFQLCQVTALDLDHVVCNSLPCLKQAAVDLTIELHDLRTRVREAIEEE